MSEEIKYFVLPSQNGFEAVLHGRRVGEITFVRIGSDKLIIDYTAVAPEFRKQNIGLTLVRSVVNFARMQKRRVITLCPFARAMFNRFSEFDDVRLMNVH